WLTLKHKKQMKKGLLIVAMMIGVTASAQDMNSKKGTPILPESGDWSIGIGAGSSLSYFGNLLNGNTANAPMSFGWTAGNDNVITGKMMKDANTAYRAKVRLGFGSTKAENQSVDVDGDGVADFDSVEIKTGGSHINLGAGIQMYRGKGRVRGFYGAEAGIGLSSGKETWTGTDFTAENKAGSTFDLNIRGFIGVEYFFAPKMSLSGEFGWGLGLTSTGAPETTVTVAGTSTTTKGGKSSSFGLDTDNAGAAVNLNFYF
ncbi:MAG: hypothetical protein ACKOX3_02405, partial [Bacteroidota bacterium]